LRKAIVKEILELCKKSTKNLCPWCGATNGVVKKGGYLMIVHERHKPKKGPEEAFVATCATHRVTVPQFAVAI
jgi:hypothetical protein